MPRYTYRSVLRTSHYRSLELQYVCDQEHWVFPLCRTSPRGFQSPNPVVQAMVMPSTCPRRSNRDRAAALTGLRKNKGKYGQAVWVQVLVLALSEL